MNIVERTKNILLKPSQKWAEIKNEHMSREYNKNCVH
jgi:hypothetical protein